MFNTEVSSLAPLQKRACFLSRLAPSAQSNTVQSLPFAPSLQGRSELAVIMRGPKLWIIGGLVFSLSTK